MRAREQSVTAEPGGAPELVDHFFRHEYGRLVATLSRRVGVQHIEAVEDAVQHALMRALESWPLSGLPQNPPAWLFRAAHNQLAGALRQRARRRDILKRHGAEPTGTPNSTPEPYLPAEVQDDLLRMLFVCCDEAIATDAQLVLALKTLCGFDVREIAQRLFISEASAYKRLARARKRLRTHAPQLLSPHIERLNDEGPDCEESTRERPSRAGLSQEGLSRAQYAERLPAVRKILYLLFTEGYLSSHAKTAIRRELCLEALRLATLLASHPIGQDPQTYALLALMHLHSARLSARQDSSGGLLLLQEQDRSLWDQQQIHVGLSWLARSAEGDTFSRYHAEAGIAAEHCLAPSFEQTRWDRVADGYALLEQTAPSALHRLNRALAIAELRGAAAGLALLEGFEPPSWLSGCYQWFAVLADLHRRSGHHDKAQRYRTIALDAAPTVAIQTLLSRRLTSERAS